MATRRFVRSPKAELAVDLGGKAEDEDIALARLVFLDRAERPIESAMAGPVGGLERSGRNGLVAVGVVETAPPETAFVAVEIALIHEDGETNDAVATFVSF